MLANGSVFMLQIFHIGMIVDFTLLQYAVHTLDKIHKFSKWSRKMDQMIEEN